MSSAWNKFVPSHSREGRVFLLFLLFWFFSGSFLFFHCQYLKKHLQQQQLQAVSNGLHRYLDNKPSSDTFPFPLQSEIPPELDFIRLVSGKEQLLITGNGRLDFTGLVNLDPQQHGIWVDLQVPGQRQGWLLVSHRLSDGTIAQAGKNDTFTGIAIYRQSVTAARWFFFFSAFFSLGGAIFVTFLIRRPLRRIQTDIQKVLEKQSPSLAKSKSLPPDLLPLYSLIEEIFHQNKQLIQEIGSSLDNVAHDLRTPMTRLRAGAEYALQSNREDPQFYRSALSDCLEESERVLSMLRIMMSVAEAESGTMRLEYQDVELLSSLEDVVALYQYVAEEEGIRVLCSGEGGLLLKADSTRIRQVWANLLDNAIKYGRDSGQVTIDCRKGTDNLAIIRFSDDGMGISENEIDRIWERLYRGDRSRTKHGLGLGLNYVKAVIEAHAGTISVTSTLHEGSSFQIHLPLAGS